MGPKLSRFSLIFSEIPKIFGSLGFALYKPWRFMNNHQKPSLKPFLGPENVIWTIMLFHFVLEKVRFPPYPAVLKREYLELGIEFWYSVKSADFALKSSFIWTQHLFYPYTPIALNLLLAHSIPTALNHPSYWRFPLSVTLNYTPR